MAIYDINGNELYTPVDVDETDICYLNDPVATVEKLQQMNRPSAVSTTLQTPPLVFLHFTDIHGDDDNLRRVIKYKNTYSSYIADILHTGDIVKQYATDGFSFWTGVNGSQYILNCIGNHDCRVGSNWNSFTEKNCYDTYFASSIANWGVTYTADVCYYYKDYATNKVRLIVLDYMHQTAEQLAWFEATLTSARTAGYDVIVAAHARPTYKFTPFDNTWDDHWKYGTPKNPSSSYPEELADGYIEAVDSFMTNGGSFICWLSGHWHKKMAGTLIDYPKQLLIAGTNAGQKYTVNTVYSRVAGTKTQDDFNIIAIDTYKKFLKVMKVGANYDMLMRKTDTMCWDYGNGTLMYAE